jgi:hypothetical protein
MKKNKMSFTKILILLVIFGALIGFGTLGNIDLRPDSNLVSQPVNAEILE